MEHHMVLSGAGPRPPQTVRTVGMPPYSVDEYGFFAASDPVDRRFTCDICWSRLYEYPWVLERITGNRVHNVAWGFTGIHLIFKAILDDRCAAVHSDRRESSLHATTVWDLTTPPRPEWVDHFDTVVCISTLEEVRGDHVAIIRDNLLSQVKRGGRLIVTFDVPGFQVDAVSAWLGRAPDVPADPLTPRTSVEPDRVLGIGDEWRVGYLVMTR